jgi:hypothetical protein
MSGNIVIGMTAVVAVVRVEVFRGLGLVVNLIVFSSTVRSDYAF